MLFLKGVFGGLVQQLPAGLWVIEGTRKSQKDGTFVNMGYIFDNFVLLAAHQTTSILRMLLTLVSLLLNCLMQNNQKLSQQLRIDKLQH